MSDLFKNECIILLTICFHCIKWFNGAKKTVINLRLFKKNINVHHRDFTAWLIWFILRLCRKFKSLYYLHPRVSGLYTQKLMATDNHTIFCTIIEPVTIKFLLIFTPTIVFISRQRRHHPVQLTILGKKITRIYTLYQIGPCTLICFIF